MYFLNGDRIYIKPKKACGTLDDQIENCLSQLKEINSGKRIFKLNFFVDTVSDEDYSRLQKNVQKQISHLFDEEMLQGFIAQPPITCKVIVEAFYYDPTIWKIQLIRSGINSSALFTNGETKILV